MSYQNMHLLYSCRIIRWYYEIDIAKGSHVATTFTAEADGVHAIVFGVCQGPEYIPAVATGGDTDQEVAFTAQCFYLSVENTVETIIIPYGSKCGGVGSECNSRESLPFSFITPCKLGCNMLGIACTATITKQQYFISGLEGGNDKLTGFGNIFSQGILNNIKNLKFKIYNLTAPRAS